MTTKTNNEDERMIVFLSQHKTMQELDNEVTEIENWYKAHGNLSLERWYKNRLKVIKEARELKVRDAI